MTNCAARKEVKNFQARRRGLEANAFEISVMGHVFVERKCGCFGYHSALLAPLPVGFLMLLQQKKLLGSRRILLVILVVALSACSLRPYRIDIQQGNVVSAEQYAQLKVGMTRDQVRFLLGTPLLMDVFHNKRWDYHYRLDIGATREVTSRGLSLFFGDDDKLVQIAADEAFRAQQPEEGSGNKVFDLSGSARP